MGLVLRKCFIAFDNLCMMCDMAKTTVYQMLPWKVIQTTATTGSLPRLQSLWGEKIQAAIWKFVPTYNIAKKLRLQPELGES